MNREPFLKRSDPVDEKQTFNDHRGSGDDVRTGDTDRQLNELSKRVHASRCQRERPQEVRHLTAVLLWSLAIGTVLVLCRYFLIGSLFALPAIAVIGYLSVQRLWGRKRPRSLQQDGDPALSSGRSLAQIGIKPAYLVHVLTTAGIIPAALAMREIVDPECDPRWVFLYLLLATLIDAVDGPLARKMNVKSNAASIDGRTIDDLLDYLTFAFIPLMLIWRMGWMPDGLGFTVVLAMAASLFGFAHREAKDEERGVFRGFPSYWNLFAIYAGIFSVQITPWLTAILLWVLTIGTVAPLWVLYPNLAPARWKGLIFIGGIFWVGCVLAMLWNYPQSSLGLTIVSLAYPLFYAIISLDHARRTTPTSQRDAMTSRLSPADSKVRA